MLTRIRKLLTQFSIRDLLWLIVVAAVAACWYREQDARIKQDIDAQRRQKETEAEFARRDAVIKNAKWQSFQARFSDLDKVPVWPDEAAPGVYFLK